LLEAIAIILPFILDIFDILLRAPGFPLSCFRPLYPPCLDSLLLESISSASFLSRSRLSWLNTSSFGKAQPRSRLLDSQLDNDASLNTVPHCSRSFMHRRPLCSHSTPTEKEVFQGLANTTKRFRAQRTCCFTQGLCQVWTSRLWIRT
jgi:hypothetical protein